MVTSSPGVLLRAFTDVFELFPVGGYEWYLYLDMSRKHVLVSPQPAHLGIDFAQGLVRIPLPNFTDGLAFAKWWNAELGDFAAYLCDEYAKEGYLHATARHDLGMLVSFFFHDYVSASSAYYAITRQSKTPAPSYFDVHTWNAMPKIALIQNGGE